MLRSCFSYGAGTMYRFCLLPCREVGGDGAERQNRRPWGFGKVFVVVFATKISPQNVREGLKLSTTNTVREDRNALKLAGQTPNAMHATTKSTRILPVLYVDEK